MEFNREQLWLRSNAKNSADRLDELYGYVKDSMKIESSLDSEWSKSVSKILSVFLHKSREKFVNCGRHKDRFLQKEATWLESAEIIPTLDKSTEAKRSGRQPTENFEDLSVERKRQRTASARASTSTSELIFAAQMSLRASGQPKASAIVLKVLESSPRTLQVIYAFVGNLKKGDEAAKGPIPFTVEEGLAYKIDGKLSRQQYMYQCQSLIDHNCNVLPSYSSISKYKQKNCYPLEVTVTESRASVPLQSLLDHTATRLCQLQADVLMSEKILPLVKFHLISKCGFDASSNHSTYNQIWSASQEDSDDSSMLLSFVVPLLLHVRNEAAGTD